MKRINKKKKLNNGRKTTAYIQLPDNNKNTYRVYINEGRNIFAGEYKTLSGAKNYLLNKEYKPIETL